MKPLSKQQRILESLRFAQSVLPTKRTLLKKAENASVWIASSAISVANRLVDKSGNNYRVYVPVATIGVSNKPTVAQDAIWDWEDEHTL